MAKTKAAKKKAPVAKKYIVQFDCNGLWERSSNVSGVFKTLEAAKKAAQKQEDKDYSMTYRAVVKK